MVSGINPNEGIEGSIEFSGIGEHDGANFMYDAKPPISDIEFRALIKTGLMLGASVDGNGIDPEGESIVEPIPMEVYEDGEPVATLLKVAGQSDPMKRVKNLERIAGALTVMRGAPVEVALDEEAQVLKERGDERKSHPYNMSWTELIEEEIKSEADNHSHVATERADLFHSFDTDGTEIEVLDLLHAYIMLFKPERLLETGTYNAYGTIAIAHALRENGHGHLISVEYSPEKARAAEEKLKALGLDEYVTIVNQASLEYIDSLDAETPPFDFAFFDSTRPDRPDEFMRLREMGLLTDLAFFHDTARSRTENGDGKEGVQATYVDRLDEIERQNSRGGIELSLSRGLRMMQLPS